MTSNNETTTWRRASRCGNGTCVEVARAGGDVLMRDSKNPRQVLRFTAAEWEAFVGGVQDGEFDG